MKSQRKFTVRHGEKLYMTCHYDSRIREITVVSLSKSGELVYFEQPDVLEKTYLQDRGIPGWRYDNRPAQLHRTMAAAERALPRARKWWTDFIRHNLNY